MTVADCAVLLIEFLGSILAWPSSQHPSLLCLGSRPWSVLQFCISHLTTIITVTCYYTHKLGPSSLGRSPFGAAENPQPDAEVGGPDFRTAPLRSSKFADCSLRSVLERPASAAPPPLSCNHLRAFPVAQPTGTLASPLHLSGRFSECHVSFWEASCAQPIGSSCCV